MGQSTKDLGALIRGARNALRLTQEQLGLAVGYSASAISRIEGNKMRLDADVVPLMSKALGIPPGRLSGAAVPEGPAIATVATGWMPDEEDAVRRRELLTGALAAGATAIVGTGTAAALPAVDLEDVLFRLPSAEPVPLANLTSQTGLARQAFTAARYNDLGRAMPGLLATAEATKNAASGRLRQQASAVLARAYVLAAELASKQHSDAAWVAADRALSAARASGMSVPVGEASRVLAITMRRSGRWSSAVHLLTGQAAELDTTQARTAAVRSTLLLTAAYSAATGQDRTTALALLDEADEDVERRPEAPSGLFTVEATRAQVDVYRIGVLNSLGTPDEGVKIAADLNIDLMPTAERRARAWTDTARMWHALGDGQQTFDALRRVEQEAPQEVRRPALRALTSDLLYGPGRVQGLREFAVRTGALA
ncbi:helix-turn-helix domain-containing protein [Streptomyces sp. NBC_01210]|uniref:helix-turn-helix domain-containing protein n=1 Tax=Streptomyces sp. NBC_01210 TaxID=2903774 RepID=UPI002E1172B3|nr:helix-turn-helix domain-containing protein [Streptomyces sp. NBC_01210]